MTTSDKRLKANIENIKKPEDILKKLTGRCFNWLGHKTKKFGLIAQEASNASEIITGKYGSYYTIDEVAIVALLVEGWKKHEKEIQSLKKQLSALKKK
jgi:hypothetical protein